MDDTKSTMLTYGADPNDYVRDTLNAANADGSSPSVVPYLLFYRRTDHLSQKPLAEKYGGERCS